MYYSNGKTFVLVTNKGSQLVRSFAGNLLNLTGINKLLRAKTEMIKEIENEET